MLTTVISLIMKRIILILLSADRKIKTILHGLCWFNSVNDLAENAMPERTCADMQLAQNWSRLWDCAGEVLYVSVRRQFRNATRLLKQFPPAQLYRLKREALAFSFRNSSLHQLLVCRHASGADSDSLSHSFFIPSQSTMRVLAIVLFLLSESTRRNSYVHCLCCCLSNRRRSYLYGC